MDINVQRFGGIDVVNLSGKASVEAPLLLRQAVADQIRVGQRFFVLHLSDGSFLDSMMIGELVACFKRVCERGGDIKLSVTPDGIAHGLIQMTGLDHAFEVYGNEREAVAAFALGPS